MKKIVNNILDSFQNKEGGFSARKLSAFVSVAICVVLSFKYAESSILVDLTGVWLLFGLLCLGIITFEQIIKLKNGNKEDENK